MLGAQGVIALSPELSSSSKKSDAFFIKEKSVLRNVLTENFGWIRYMMNKLGPEISVEIVKD